MVQSRGVSRYYGQLSTLDACLDRAGATFACAFSSTGSFDAAAVRARHDACFDPGFIAQMRVLLCATAVSALAVLVLILL